MTASKSRDCRDSAHSPIVFSEHGKRLAGEAIAYYDSEVVPVIRARPDEVAAIYFIGTISRLKIGLARRDVDQRLTSIQAMSPEEIDVYACVLGTLDACLIASRISVALGDIPRSDAAFIDAAHGLATGLFGPAFSAASAGQKAIWVDMCERALREAAGAPMVT